MEPRLYIQVFTARRYASAVYAMAWCRSIRASVCHNPMCFIKAAERVSCNEGRLRALAANIVFSVTCLR